MDAHNDRQLVPRQVIHSSISEAGPSYQNMPSEQGTAAGRGPIRHRPASPQREPLPKLRTSAALHFEYRTRYPSPPPTDPGFLTQSANPPHFTYPSPSDHPSMTDHGPNHRRTASSPPRHPSPILSHSLHRTNRSSSSTGSSPLTPFSNISHRPPTHRGVDNHQHVEILAAQRPSMTQLPRDDPEQQGPLCRHAVDSSHVPDQNNVSLLGRRKRSLSSLPPPPPRLQFPPQPGQTSGPYSTPSLPTLRHDNPPASVISPTSPSTSTTRPPQPPQSPSQLITTDEPVINTAVEGIDAALEPLRLGFENAFAETVQSVRQVMSKMQRDLTRLVAAERRKNTNLMRCLVNSSEKFRNQECVVEELRRQNGSLTEKALENERLKRDNAQKTAVMDALNQENHVLRRENDELKNNNDEALLRAAGRVFQYKEELAKVKADVDTLRKRREVDDALSTIDAKPKTTVASFDLHHKEMTRLHAERERQRIFNDAVKQLRALTTLEDSPCSQSANTTHEHDSEEAMVASTLSDVALRDRTRSLPLEISTLKQNPSSSPSTFVAQVHYTINKHPGLSIPPPLTKVVVSTNNADKSKVEADQPDSRDIVDVDMDVDDISIVPPVINVRTPDPVAKPGVGPLENDVQTVEQQTQPTDGELQVDMEAQRQRQRQARRGPTPPPPPVSSPQASSRKTRSPSSAGMKRTREEYETCQVAEDHDGVRTEEPSIVEGERRTGDPALHSLSSVEAADIIHVDAEDSESVLERMQKDVDIIHISSKDKTRGKVTPPAAAAAAAETLQILPTITPTATVTDTHSKTIGRWPHYTHYRDNGVLAPTRSLITEPSTAPPAARPLPTSPVAERPPPPTKRHPKLGINHMDLLYKTEKDIMVCRICRSLEQNPDATTAERRKAKARTKKFPLNASWAELVQHCQTEHTKACEDMEKLSPSQIAELKQRR